MFFNRCLAFPQPTDYPTINFGPGRLTDAMSVIFLFLVCPQGYGEPLNEVAFQGLSKHPMEFEWGNIPILKKIS